MRKILVFIFFFITTIKCDLLCESKDIIWSPNKERKLYVYSNLEEDALYSGEVNTYLYFSPDNVNTCIPKNNYLKLRAAETCFISIGWFQTEIEISTNCILDVVDSLNNNNDIIFTGKSKGREHIEYNYFN